MAIVAGGEQTSGATTGILVATAASLDFADCNAQRRAVDYLSSLEGAL